MLVCLGHLVTKVDLNASGSLSSVLKLINPNGQLSEISFMGALVLFFSPLVEIVVHIRRIDRISSFV